MKVVLLQDIPKIGRKYDIKNVADGYARNLLLPRRLAVPATQVTVARIEMEKGKREASEREERDTRERNVRALAGATVTVALTASERGHLFSKLSAKDIAVITGIEKGLTIPESAVELTERIGDLGSHQVMLRAGDTRATMTLIIERAPTKSSKNYSKKLATADS